MFVNEDWMWSSWTNIRRRGGEASLIFTVWYSVCALFWDLSAQSWSSSNSAASSNSNSCSAALYKTKVGLTCSVSVECMQEKKPFGTIKVHLQQNLSDRVRTDLWTNHKPRSRCRGGNHLMHPDSSLQHSLSLSPVCTRSLCDDVRLWSNTVLTHLLR